MRNWLDIHPKIKAAGLAAGLTAIGEGVCLILGIPAPDWLAPAVSLVVPVLAGYLKAS